MSDDPKLIQIGAYIIDAALSEDHTFDSEATEYPVEQGSDITDNIRAKPIEVTVVGVVSNAPMGAILKTRTFEGGTLTTATKVTDNETPVDDALAALLAIRDAREPVPIITSLKSYDSMAMTSLSVPSRDAQNAESLEFTAKFRQIIIITNARTLVKVAVPSHGRKDKDGHKPVKGYLGVPMLWRAEHSNLIDHDIVVFYNPLTKQHYFDDGTPLSPAEEQDFADSTTADKNGFHVDKQGIIRDKTGRDVVKGVINSWKPGSGAGDVKAFERNNE